MITLERALALIAAGEEEARRQDLALAFAVVDDGGHLVALHRMDGAPWIAPEVATGKAWTAAAYRAPSAAQGDKMKELHAFSAVDQRRHARPLHAADRRAADHRRRRRDRRDGRERRHRPAGRGRRPGGARLSAEAPVGGGASGAPAVELAPLALLALQTASAARRPRVASAVGDLLRARAPRRS